MIMGHIFKVGTQLCNITNFERFTSFFTFFHITQKVVITTLSNYISEERLESVDIHYAQFGPIFRVALKLYRV